MSGTDKAIRVSTTAVVVAVAGVAAYVSYRHALEVVEAHGETGATARLVPFTVDGLVYVSSMVLLDSARRGVAAPGLARWTLGLGIAATVAANVLHGIAHGTVGAVIAAWPAVTLVLVFELLMTLIRGDRSDQAFSALTEKGTGGAPAEPLGAWQPWPVEAPTASVAVVAPPVPGDVPEPDAIQVRAAEVFSDDIAAGRVPSVRAVKRELRVGQPKAEEVRKLLSVLVSS